MHRRIKQSRWGPARERGIESIGLMWKKSLWAVVFGMSCWVATSVDAASLGDRLIVAINGVPFTQRQIEIYIHVKESLRKSSSGETRMISAANWRDAISVYTEDMVILQESQRLGSFQTPDQATAKYLAVVRKRIDESATLRATLTRLGAEGAVVNRTLDEVLRIAAFRRSKETQGDQVKRDRVKDADPKPATSRWLDDLKARAVIRRYQGADVYVDIEPVPRGVGDVR